MKLDYAVVGAGIAGTYAAWRIAQAKPGARIGLFEYSRRIGGRLLSVFLPGMPSVPVELGGMRYMPKSHYLVAGLVKQLDLPTRPFPMGAADPVGSSKNLYYLRGRHFIEEDFADPSKIPYALLPHEAGCSPTELQHRIFRLICSIEDPSTDALYDLKVFGQPLYRFGFWNLVARLVSAEAYAFMTDAGGYAANTANTNAVYQLPATEYGDKGVEFRGFERGFQSVPLTLAARFREAGGQIHLGQALRSIERDGEGCRLTFRPTRETNRAGAEPASGHADARTQDAHGDHARRTHIDHAGHQTEVHAAHVILAMPRRSLELVHWEGWHHRDVALALRTVQNQHAFKLALAYVSPWWRELGLQYGRSITDLPIRQTYYMHSEADFEAEKSLNQSALLMASYNDIASVPFWRGLSHGEPFQGFEPPFAKDAVDHAALEAAGYHAPKHLPRSATQVMVDTAQEQLALLHRMKIPAPYAAAYHDWSDDPFGGGWHEWRSGYDARQVISRMLQPLPDQPVYTCGEAYSSNQGWAEGALDTAETLLQRHLDLPRPKWIHQDWAQDGSTPSRPRARHARSSVAPV